MGNVYATITLKNVIDAEDSKRGLINEQEIRQKTVKALVDTGAGTLIINEELRQQLGLEVTGERPISFANGTREMMKIAGLVEIHWENRAMICQPVVVPGGDLILLGLIPLEAMDLMVDPVRQELTGAHGDEMVTLLVGVR